MYFRLILFFLVNYVAMEKTKVQHPRLILFFLVNYLAIEKTKVQYRRLLMNYKDLYYYIYAFCQDIKTYSPVWLIIYFFHSSYMYVKLLSFLFKIFFYFSLAKQLT